MQEEQYKEVYMDNVLEAASMEVDSATMRVPNASTTKHITISNHTVESALMSIKAPKKTTHPQLPQFKIQHLIKLVK